MEIVIAVYALLNISLIDSVGNAVLASSSAPVATLFRDISTQGMPAAATILTAILSSTLLLFSNIQNIPGRENQANCMYRGGNHGCDTGNIIYVINLTTTFTYL